VKQENLPIVSIVVPCYNHAKYVKDTIQSIINQSYENIELIIIDDGSKDGSVAMIQEMISACQNRFRRFEFRHRANKGLSKTLNEGIEWAEGKYFSALASDDIYMPNKVEFQVEFMEDNKQYGMCYGKVLVFENSIDNTFEYNSSNRQGWVFNELINDGNFIPAPSVFILKDVFNKVGRYDETLFMEDWDMWLRIAKEYQIGYVDEYLVYYRRHDSNISKQTYKMYEAQKMIFDKYRDLENYETIIRNKKIQWFGSLARRHKKEAIKYLPYVSTFMMKDIRVVKGMIKLFFSFKLF
jgi:alpha-1,3-rhamnosyltransferase